MRKVQKKIITGFETMCFSAEASFTGAAVLAGIGYINVKQTPSKENLLWAAIPLFFAIQQCCEGIVWLGLTHQLMAPPITLMAKDLYLFFALGFWPVWIPFALLFPEKDPLRRKLLLLTLVLGVGIAYINLSSFPPTELNPNIAGHSIQYFGETPFYGKFIYLLAVGLPSFISSIKNMWAFGLLTVLSCVAAAYFYSATFTSVWCFSAALMSAMLYMLARNLAKETTAEQELQTTALPLKQEVENKRRRKQ